MAQRKSSSKKSNANSTQNRRKKYSNSSSDKMDALAKEIYLIALVALCIFLFLCNFSLFGAVGEVIKKVMFGLFGILSYVLPIAFLVGTFFRIANRGDRVASRKLFAFGVVLYIVGMLFHMFSGITELIEGNLVGSLYSICSADYKGGGLFCGLLAYPMEKYLTTLGSVLILLVLLIICLIIITEKSLIGGVKKQGKNIVDKSKEHREHVRERRAMLKEEEEEIIDEGEVDAHAARRMPPPDMAKRNVHPETFRDASKSESKKAVRKDGYILDKQQMQRQDMHEIILNEEVFSKPKQMQMQEALEQRKKDYMDSSFEADLVAVKPKEEEVTGSMSMPSVPDSFEVVEPVESVESIPTVEPSAIKPHVKPYIPPMSDQKKASPGHSFGMTEEYKSPDRKAQEARDKEIAKRNEELAARGGTNPVSKYKLPTVDLLNKSQGGAQVRTQELEETKAQLERVFETFGVKIKPIRNYSMGPAVTRFEIEPEMGVKVSRIASLADDIKLNLAAADIRIEAPIPGKAAVGIEVPNKVASAVGLRELLESSEYKNFDSKLAFAVGKDLAGQTVCFDIAKMPHVLIAGSTGSGKSVCINTLIMSILFKARPDEVQLIMVDPKVVELKVYNGIPHLITPVVTDPKKAAATLQWAVAEMTERYKKFSDNNVREIKGYNKLVAESGDPTMKKMPQIVIIVDELADLMMTAGKDVEEAIVRLAQLARAAGIHLVIATQRPSVNVITGLIKANMPSRIAFAVTSGIDSRTILDTVGAEKLLGKGDMLFHPSGYTKAARVQGAFVSDSEVGKVVEFILKQGIESPSDSSIEAHLSGEASSSDGGGMGLSSSADNDGDDLILEAGRFIIEKEKASIGMLQRQFRIGFNRAARIMDQLAELGVVGEEEGTKPRRILMTIDEFMALMNG